MHRRVQRQHRLLLTSFHHEPLSPSRKSCGYFLGAGMNPTLQWDQTLHQAEDGSVNGKGMGRGADASLQRFVDESQGAFEGEVGVDAAGVRDRGGLQQPFVQDPLDRGGKSEQWP